MIGLYSPRPQSGKSTVAGFLQTEYQYRVMSFATPLKKIANAFFDQIGVDPFNLIDKEKPVPNNKGIEVSPRRVWQTLGTEWGRECIDPDVWVKIAKHDAKLYMKGYEGFRGNNRVVFDDVRFVNEFDMIHELGGEVWCVHRPSAESNGHVSDDLLSELPFDRFIDNDSTKHMLLGRAEEALVQGRDVAFRPSSPDASWPVRITNLDYNDVTRAYNHIPDETF